MGGGAAPFARADHVIDALPFDEAGASAGESGPSGQRRFTGASWTRLDLCERRPWPFPDKAFDFAVCSHVLEDVRDPVWVCSELSRIARAGYVETPSRVAEQSRGVESPRYAGFCHHRWLVSRHGTALEFRHKPHLLHAVNDAIVADLSASERITPRFAIVALRWEGALVARETLEFDEAAMVQELCGYARHARSLPGLTEVIHMPIARRLKRHIFYRRLSRGRR